MKINYRNIKCKIGLHKWVQSKPLTGYDMFPSPFDSKYSTPTRTCVRCGERQKWLPGYGGSEIGCWI